MSDDGKALYEKRKSTIITNKFGGDALAYEAWLTDHMRNIASSGGKSSTSRPFKDREKARFAGRQARKTKRLDNESNNL